MPISKDEFRSALGRFASGVTVVTTRSRDHQPQGLTVSAFSSLSLDPPLVLVCIDRRNGSHGAFIERGAFAVNLLADDQEELSRRFASKIPDKFAGVACYNGLDDVPVLEESLVSLECRLVQAHDGGDHTIFIGQIEAAKTRDADPLVYFQGAYARLATAGLLK
jgi:flavin reductase (DIM6/NTAB) family NADH-FMN oxidoreductase RutF